MGIPVKLSVELVPRTAHRTNLRSELTTGEWRQVSAWCAHEAGGVCEVCDAKPSGRSLDCPERWSYDLEVQVQTLVRVVGLCPACHEVKHFGHALVTGNQDRAFAHLRRVNGWSAREANRYLEWCADIYAERSQVEASTVNGWRWRRCCCRGKPARRWVSRLFRGCATHRRENAPGFDRRKKMTKQELEKYLGALTDADLLDRTQEAVADCRAASVEQPNSEWHDACFAGVLAYAGEVQRRGLRVGTLH